MTKKVLYITSLLYTKPLLFPAERVLCVVVLSTMKSDELSTIVDITGMSVELSTVFTEHTKRKSLKKYNKQENNTLIFFLRNCIT